MTISTLHRFVLVALENFLLDMQMLSTSEKVDMFSESMLHEQRLHSSFLTRQWKIVHLKIIRWMLLYRNIEWGAEIVQRSGEKMLNLVLILYLTVQDAELYDIARRIVKELLGRIVRRSVSLHEMFSNWTEIWSMFRHK